MKCIDSNQSNLWDLVRCQTSAFPDALSTKLGSRFTFKMLSWYMDSYRGIMYHIEQEGDVVGFVGGIKTTTPGLPGAATSITQYSFRTFIIAFLLRPWLIFHPDSRKRISFIWNNIKIHLGIKPGIRVSNNENTSEDFIPFMGLVVIAVDPKYQGRGYGSVLLKEFEERARNGGFKRIYLSVKTSNNQAIAAYRKSGWIVGRQGPEEQVMFKNLE